jgi:hypothetical protein
VNHLQAPLRPLHLVLRLLPHLNLLQAQAVVPVPANHLLLPHLRLRQSPHLQVPVLVSHLLRQVPHFQLAHRQAHPALALRQVQVRQAQALAHLQVPVLVSHLLRQAQASHRLQAQVLAHLPHRQALAHPQVPVL